MKLTEIALKNLFRRKGKAAFVLAGLVVGVATVVAIISMVEAMTHDINHKLEKYGANILIVPRTDNLTLSYGGMTIGGVSYAMQEIREDQLAMIHSIRNAHNIAAVGPMLLGTVQANQQQVVLAGMDFNVAPILKPWWKLSGVAPDDDDLLLGAETARILKADIGDTVSIDRHPLRVSGVLESTGSQDDQLMFSSLKTAQKLLDKEGRISMAEVAALCSECPVKEMVAQISDALPATKVMAIQQVVKGRMETLDHLRHFSYGISLVVVLIGSMVVLVTMMNSVRERTEEIGIFRAVGFRRFHVMRIVVTEVVMIALLAGLLGYLSGLGGAQLAVGFFDQGSPVAVSFDPVLAGGAMALALAIGLAASIYPALMAARLDPNEALRAL